MRYLFLATVLVVGCGDIKEDMKILCSTDVPASVRDANPAMRQRAHFEYVMGKLRTSEAKEFLKDLGNYSPAERMERLQTKAKKAGVEPCPAAESSNDPEE